MAQNLGDGFAVKIFADVNKDSFERGKKQVDNVSNSIAKLVGVVKNAAPLLLAGTAGVVETAELKASKAIGISTEALDSWKASASIAGVNAQSLTSDMANLENKMQALKLGQVDAGLAQNLGLMGINYGDFAALDASERILEVINKARSMEDQGKAALLVGNILGASAKDYYYYMQLSGKSVEEQLAFAKRLNFTTEESKNKAMGFMSAFNGLKSASTSLGLFAGSELGGLFTPYLLGLTDVLAKNREFIQSGIVTFIDTLGAGVKAVVGGVQAVAPIIGAVVDKFGGLDQVIVKVGLGLVGFKVVGLATKIAAIASSINLIHLGLAALGGAAIFEIFKNPEKYNLDDISAKFESLSNHIKGIVDAIGGADIIKAGFAKISEGLAYIVTGSIESIVTILDALASVVDKLINKDWSGLAQNMKEFFTSFIFGDSSGEAGSDTKKEPNILDKTLRKGKNLATGNIFGFALDVANDVYEFSNKKKTAQDGIISPSGQLTQVAPDDWTFAVRDVGALASAFTPYGAGASNSNTSNITINQNISVGGNASGFDVKRQAYAGASKALQESINQSATRLQLMPATK